MPGMSHFKESDHPRAGGDGQFTPNIKAESDIALTPSFTPEQSQRHVVRICELLDGRYRQDLSDMARNIKRGISAGTTDAVTELQRLMEDNRDGRCITHTDKPAQSSPERYCTRCQIAAMVEGTVGDRPAPTVFGVQPTRPQQFFLKRTKSVQVEDPDNEHVITTTTDLTGDKPFAEAVRTMFGTKNQRTKVKVTEETWEDFTRFTTESDTTITVECGKQSASYQDTGALMRALDDSTRPDPITMASRFMQATDAPRPLLYGTAAVFIRSGGYSDPKPVFGKILNVFSQGSNPSFEFHGTDGTRQYIEFRRVAAILETSDSGEYVETE